MTVFADYARYYNLLYRDKDYTGETAFVPGIVKKHGCVPHECCMPLLGLPRRKKSTIVQPFASGTVCNTVSCSRQGVDMKFTATARCALICALALLTVTGEAQAYFDPGTGSMLLQALAAGLIGATVFWRRIRDAIRKLFPRKKDAS